MGELAAKLRARLEPYVAGDVEGFTAQHTQEAARLAEAAFGEAMLHTIGCALPAPLHASSWVVRVILHTIGCALAAPLHATKKLGMGCL